MCDSDTVTSFNNDIATLFQNLNSLTDQFSVDLTNKVEETNKVNEELKKMIDTKEKTINELEETITELEKKVNEKSSLPVETEENKFDIIRGQAKEIAAKDKEIIRLTEQLVKLKGSNDKNNSSDTHGWSPTSCPTPKPTIPDKLELTEEVAKEEVTEEEVAKEEVTEEEEEEFEMITYRKVNYFLGSENKVYAIVKDEDGDDDIGECIGNWVQNKSGKWKVVKH